MTVQEAAYALLKEVGRPLPSRQLAKQMLERGMVSSTARDPVFSIASTLEKNIRDKLYNRPELTFIQSAQGRLVALAESMNVLGDGNTLTPIASPALTSGSVSEGLAGKVLRWLGETGYPLELRVGRRFQKEHWHVNYGRWYRDSGKEEKSRELDVQALVAAINPKTASVFFSLCIECKSSKDKPWIALSADSTLGSGGISSIAMGRLSQMTLTSARTEGVALPALFAADTPRAGGIVQAFSGKSEGSPVTPFAALQQARSAAVALDAEYRLVARDVSSELVTTGVFLPMVVLDGALFRYSVDDELKESLEPIDLVMATVPGDAEHPDALVPVLSHDYAVAMSRNFRTLSHNFCVAMMPHASTIKAALGIELLAATDGN